MTLPQSASIITTPPGSGLGTDAEVCFNAIKADILRIMTTQYTLVDGTWGVGSLLSNVAPITQNGNYTGANANAGAAFSMFLRATDTGTAYTGGGTMWGLYQNLILDSNNVVGNRGGASFAININSATGNPPTNYVALASVCNMKATDAVTGSSAFGANLIASIPAAGVIVKNLVGAEVDVNETVGSVISGYRAGFNTVDISAPNNDLQGVLADFGIGLNYANFNANAAGASHGFKTGLSFGTPISYFPVSPTGTIIYVNNNSAATGSGLCKALYGVDFRLCAFQTGGAAFISTGFQVDPTGQVVPQTATVATLPVGLLGGRATVTDSTVAITAGIGAIVVGGGTFTVPVFWDGVNWRIGG